jgi:hypothetical protein
LNWWLSYFVHLLKAPAQFRFVYQDEGILF